jgi:hypothetical protein
MRIWTVVGILALGACKSGGDDTEAPGETDVTGDTDVTVDTDCGATTWYPDADGDGYGTDAGSFTACEAPANAAPVGGDCADDDAAVHPEADPRCNGADNDCDGDIDTHGVDGGTWYADLDGDGYGGEGVEHTDTDEYDACELEGAVTNGDDCDDTDALVNPAAAETCDGVDSNCTGDETDATDPTAWYHDADRDGVGGELWAEQCNSPARDAVRTTGDCDETDPAVHPGAPELCDSGVDDDCDGTTGEDGTISFLETAGGKLSLDATFAAGSSGNPVAYAIADDGVLAICGGTWYVTITDTAANLAITGVQAGSTLSGGGAAPVIHVEADDAALSLDSVTITEGFGCNGTAIGALTEASCSSGGSSYGASQRVTVDLLHTDVIGNGGNPGATAIYTGYDGAMTIDESTISGNTVSTAVFVDGGSLLTTDASTIAQNSGLGVAVFDSDYDCFGKPDDGLGVWGNGNGGAYVVGILGSSSLDSTSCDWTSTLDNVGYDLYVQTNQSQVGTLFTFGDDATFTCLSATETCQ